MDVAMGNRAKADIHGNENLTFLPSIIFYMVKEPENEIHILRILIEEREWGRILKEQREYTYLE